MKITKPAKDLTWLDPNSPWKSALNHEIIKSDYGTEETLEKGVNFFILALEILGAKPRFSCEGHPNGFYICFHAPYKLALEIESCGFFRVSISRSIAFSSKRNYWRMDLGNTERLSEQRRLDCLNQAALAWTHKILLRRLIERKPRPSRRLKQETSTLS